MKKILFALAFALTFTSAAQAEFKFNKIGGSLGLVSPDTIDSTIGFGLEMPFGPVYDKIHVGSTMDFWSSSIGVLNFSDFIIGGYGRYQDKFVLGTNFPVELYGGAGLDIHFYSYDVSSIISGSSTEIGFSLFAGGIYNLKSNLDLTAEARYRTNVDQFHLKLGAIYHF